MRSATHPPLSYLRPYEFYVVKRVRSSALGTTLTHRTIERRPARLRDLSNAASTAAPHTAFAPAIVDAESLRVVVRGQPLDRVRQDRLDRPRQTMRAWAGLAAARCQ